MLVNIFEVDQTTNEEVMTGWRCHLDDIRLTDEIDVANVHRELAENGVAWVGGGAAQLFKITVEEGDIHDDNNEPHGQREPFTAMPRSKTPSPITPTPETFEHVGYDAEGASLFAASHEAWNEVRISFPRGYFAGNFIPPRVTIESFVITEG